MRIGYGLYSSMALTKDGHWSFFLKLGRTMRQLVIDTIRKHIKAIDHPPIYKYQGTWYLMHGGVVELSSWVEVLIETWIEFDWINCDSETHKKMKIFLQESLSQLLDNLPDEFLLELLDRIHFQWYH